MIDLDSEIYIPVIGVKHAGFNLTPVALHESVPIAEPPPAKALKSVRSANSLKRSRFQPLTYMRSVLIYTGVIGMPAVLTVEEYYKSRLCGQMHAFYTRMSEVLVHIKLPIASIRSNATSILCL